jgi:hypothetical protein
MGACSLHPRCGCAGAWYRTAGVGRGRREKGKEEEPRRVAGVGGVAGASWAPAFARGGVGVARASVGWRVRSARASVGLQGVRWPRRAARLRAFPFIYGIKLGFGYVGH